MEQEKINVVGGGEWHCLCGNIAESDGFLCCNEKGEEVEPDIDWNGLYVCNRCGRIINQDTLIVVGNLK